MKIKPCPFCGGEVSIALMGSNGFGYWMITRGHKENACTCRVFMESNRFLVELDGSFDGAKQKEELIKKWNRRKPLEDIVEQLEKEKGIAFVTLANTGNKELDFTYQNVVAYMDKAIEIVKPGGKE